MNRWKSLAGASGVVAERRKLAYRNQLPKSESQWKPSKLISFSVLLNKRDEEFWTVRGGEIKCNPSAVHQVWGLTSLEIYARRNVTFAKDFLCRVGFPEKKTRFSSACIQFPKGSSSGIDILLVKITQCSSSINTFGCSRNLQDK